MAVEKPTTIAQGQQVQGGKNRMEKEMEMDD